MTYDESMLDIFGEDISKDEIDNALDFIDKELTTTEEPQAPAVVEEGSEKYSMDKLTDIVLDNVNEVNGQADDIYRLFYQKIVIDKDRSEATSNNLVESLKVKNENIKAVTELVKAKAKLEAAKNSGKGAGGIYVQAQSGSEVGIDLSNLS